MLKPVLDYFNSITPLSAELVHEIEHHAVIKGYKKGEFILKAGKVYNHTFWILKDLCAAIISGIQKKLLRSFYGMGHQLRPLIHIMAGT